MTSLLYRPVLELSSLIRSGALSPVELMEETLKRIEAVNPSLNAFVALRAEEALAEARTLAEDLAAQKEVGPLAGIPIGVKDLENAAGMVTSFGSIPFKDNLVKQDSIQVARLKAAGAIVVGKTNTPEFGFTGFTKNRLFGTTRNPWNPERTPGGSSGGSAAAVAAGMVPLATGSDAGGSIRIPACYCGCFGIKPTYGRVPLGPADPLFIGRTWTLGPLSLTVADAALYLDCVSGAHPADPDSLPKGKSYLAALERPPGRLKIGFSPDLGYARVEKEVMSLAERAVRDFEDMGHVVEYWDGRFPDVGDAWSRIMICDIYAMVYKILDKVRPELNRTISASLDLVSGMGMTDYISIQEIRKELNRILQGVFDRYDLLLTPAMPTEAFKAEGPPPAEIDGHAVPVLRVVAFTYPFNISGHPAAVVRTGLTRNGLPAGLQIVGPRHREDLVLQAAGLYEQVNPWNDHWPKQQG